MQAIILAAGLAKRLRPLTDTTPKCLLSLGNTNLLHLTFENIIANGIKDFIVVTGYRQEMIKKYISDNFGKCNVRFLTNNDYMNNNNSYSLWMTKKYVEDEIILLDSDILFDKEIISVLINSNYDNCAAVNISENLDAEQIKVRLDKDNRILEIGKEVPLDQSAGESIGIEKFSRSFMNEIYGILDRKILTEKNVNEFYEVTFQEIINKNDIRNSIYSVDVSDFKCVEIDTIEDYNNAQKLFAGLR